MSGFQIPGLGHAKPDEKLPPLPTNESITSPSPAAAEEPSKDVEITDAPTEGQSTQAAPQSEQNAHGPATEQSSVNDDAMAIDRPASPPSLTGALEAALGGLEGDNAEQVLAQSGAGQTTEMHTTEEQTGQGDNPEWEMDSSPYESSSDTTSTDSSDEDSDNEGYELLGVEETARLLMEAEGGSDDEGKGGKSSTAAQLRTKNEIAEEALPRPDITITPEMKIEELGAVEHIVENMVLVKAFTPGEYQVLDNGSVLCNADRVVLGAVAETIGKVLQPMYTMHYNSEQEIQELGMEIGTKVFYPVDHASFVFTEPLKNMKGSDASNLHDEEVGDDEMEFSDDEKEAEYKKALKDKKRKKAAAGGARGGRGGPHPLSQEMGANGELNYDDDDGPYKPLTRPPGFGDGPVSQESLDTHPRFSRGRGRGEARGRGNRGRGFNRGGRGGGRGGSTSSQDGYSLPPQSSSPSTSAFSGSPMQNFQPPPPPGWNPQAQGSAPAMPNFGFQFPGWPQQPPAQGQSSAVPPPPPGWPGAAQGQGQGQQGGNGQNPMMNPALLAALMSHMQGQQGQQGGQQQWQPPGGQGQ